MIARLVALILVTLGLTFWNAPASAAVITYTATNTSGQEWRYDYTVTAQPADANIDEFAIFFDLALFDGANLRSLTSPAGWDGLIQQPDPLLPNNGLIDVIALAGGIAPVSSLGGFSVLFDWFGAGAPGSQAFDVIDAETFRILSSGFTTPADVVGVPEPGSAALLALGLLLLGFGTRRRAIIQFVR